MEIKTVKQVTQEIHELKTKRSDANLAIFRLMAKLQVEETWKKDSFYTGTDIDKKEWKDAKFSFIVRRIAGWTMTRFNSIQEIVKMKDGREIFLKYGYENSVALKNMSEKERPLVLSAVETHVISHSVIPNFYNVIGKIFPDRRQIKPITDGKEAKINNLLEENKKLKEQNKQFIIKLNSVEEENRKLRELMIGKLLETGMV